MTTQHTPTPWVIESQARVSAHSIVDVDCIPIAEVRIVGRSEGGRGTAADVEFIVRACNAHDELVAALAQIARLSAEGEVSANMQYALGDIARAALARVQG